MQIELDWSKCLMNLEGQNSATATEIDEILTAIN
jgi:hypothetical protein